MAAVGFLLFVIGALGMTIAGRQYPGNWIGVPLLALIFVGPLLIAASFAIVLWRVMP